MAKKAKKAAKKAAKPKAKPQTKRVKKGAKKTAKKAAAKKPKSPGKAPKPAAAAPAMAPKPKPAMAFALKPKPAMAAAPTTPAQRDAAVDQCVDTWGGAHTDATILSAIIDDDNKKRGLVTCITVRARLEPGWNVPDWDMTVGDLKIFVRGLKP